MVAVTTIFYATPLFYYGAYDVLNSHFASFFLAMLFFFLLYRKKEIQHKDFFLGLVAGFAMNVRLQDAAVIVIWLFFSKVTYRKIISFFLGFALSIIPLALYWMYTFNGFFNHSYFRNLAQELNSRSIDFFGSLFHPVTGLFSRTPIIFILFLFFLYLLKNKKAKKYVPLFLFFLIQYVIITIQGGWVAAAYGGRMYISSLVFFALLLSEFLIALNKKYSYFVVVSVCSFFVLLNILSIGSFILLEKQTSNGKPGIESSTIKRVERLFKQLYD